MHEDPYEDAEFTGESRGFSGFLRSILSGIPWSERAEADETIVLDAPTSSALKIDNANGRTRVIGEDRDDIELAMHKVARAESEEEAEALVAAMRAVTRDDGDHMTLEFEIPGRWNRRGRIDAELRVPRSLRVAVIAANGRICVSGLRSALKAKSSNGAIRIEDVVGDIIVATSNARVKTSCTCGKLMARASNGPIHLDEHSGSVDASTSNGLIHCDLDQLGRDGVVLATSNGRIVLELPEGVDGDVDVRVDNGVIRSALDVGPASNEKSGRLKGTLGRGGTPIKLRASNGSISLR